jgi:hypothetical protein
VSEEFIFDEMVQAGIEQLKQGRKKKLSDREMVLNLYLAMRGIYRLETDQSGSDLVH